MAKKSRDKGAAGERELVNVLREFGFTARRTAQMQSQDSSYMPDVTVEEWPDVWIECKREKASRPRPAYRQGCREVAETGSGKIPLAVTRGDREPWMVYGRQTDLLPRQWGSTPKQWFLFHHLAANDQPQLKRWWQVAQEARDEFDGDGLWPHVALLIFDHNVNDTCAYTTLESLVSLPQWGERRT